jgi:hypothetical protein
MSNLGILEENKFLKTWKLCSVFHKNPFYKAYPINTFVAKWQKFTEIFLHHYYGAHSFFLFLILCLFSFLGQTLLDTILCDAHDKGFSFHSLSSFVVLSCHPFLFVDFNYSIDELFFPLFHFPLKISLTTHFFLLSHCEVT